MQLVEHVPTDPPLFGLVERVFSFEHYKPEHKAERLVPNGHVTLIIALDSHDRHVYDNTSGASLQVCREAWLSGTHSHFITIGDTSIESRLSVAEFVPGRALPLIHVALHEFNDLVVPAVEVFGESILTLRSRLRPMRNAEDIIAEIEKWLVARYKPELEPPEIILIAMEALQADPGGVEFTQLVETHGSVSYKHFVDLFKKHVGPNPKTMQRILRFSQVFAQIHDREHVDWAELSLELGYSDQSHFIRDFSAFSGYRPRRFVEDGHERLNFFPVEADVFGENEDGAGGE